VVSLINCVIKTGREGSLEGIAYVGGRRGGGLGKPFLTTREQCADDIRLERESYYIHVAGENIYLQAFQLVSAGPWFIKSRLDPTNNDLLSSLPECPR
jgi:hypothetical protein